MTKSTALPESAHLASAYEVEYAGATGVAVSHGVEVEVVHTGEETVRTLRYPPHDGGAVVGMEELSNGDVVVLQDSGRVRVLQVRVGLLLLVCCCVVGQAWVDRPPMLMPVWPGSGGCCCHCLGACILEAHGGCAG